MGKFTIGWEEWAALPKLGLQLFEQNVRSLKSIKK